MCAQARVGLADDGADPQRTALTRDAVQRGDAVHVDEERRPEQAHVERGDEALTAREDLCFVASAGERSERVFERLGADVVERRRFHD